MLDKDHLFQVASITKGQIRKLNKAGIHTMLQLADSPVLSVSGIHSTVFAKLKSQAAIQIKSKLKSQKLEGSIDSDRPEFEILLPSQNEKKGLSSLPPHSSMDIFFDIEGFPLDEGELKYL